MKNLVLFLLLVLITARHMLAQVPKQFHYQGIARHTDGQPFSNQTLQIKISILPAVDALEADYEEKHQVITNAFGLYTLSIGAGQVIRGSMQQVAWENGNQFMRVAVDLKGNGQYAQLGTTQLLSVPYALYADKAGNASGKRAGNQHYLSKFDGSGSSSNEINSQLYDNGSNIGIGTTAPAAKVHIS